MLNLEDSSADVQVAKWIESYLTRHEEVPLFRRVVALAFAPSPTGEVGEDFVLNTALLACIIAATKGKTTQDFIMEIKDLLATDFPLLLIEAYQLSEVRKIQP